MFTFSPWVLKRRHKEVDLFLGVHPPVEMSSASMFGGLGLVVLFSTKADKIEAVRHFGGWHA